MNNLVPTSPISYGDLELLQEQREIAAATPIEQLLAGAYRQRFLLAAAFLIPIVIAFAVSLMLPKSYTAVASVQLDQQVPHVVPETDLDPQLSPQDAPRFLQTELDRVRSRSVAEKVENRLKLEKSPSRMKALGIDPNKPGFIATLKKAVGLAQDSPFDASSAVIGALQTSVAAGAGLNTRLAEISFTSTDPNVSAEIANAYADALVESNIDAKVDTSAQAKQYLQGQLADAKKKLETSEKAMLAYARRADLTTTVMQTDDPKNEKITSLRDQQLGTMTDSLSQATARRIDAEQSWNQVRNTSPMSLPDVQSNQAIQTLVSQRAQAVASLEEERQRHTENYPSVREGEAKVKELDGQIATFSQSIKSAYYGRYVAAAQQQHQLLNTVGSLKGAAMSERERAVGFDALSREVETAKAFYDGLLQRYEQVAAASGAPSANVTIIDRAWPPSTADGGLTRNVALGGMSGLVLALLLGSIRERMHRVIRSSEDLEQALNLPSLGVVPQLAKADNVHDSLDDPHSALSEAYYSIGVALEHGTAAGLPKTLLTTSSGAAEGKSTSAMGIAQSLAAMGKRVLVIDADLRRPSSTKPIADSSKATLSDVLTGSARVEKVIEQLSRYPNLCGEGGRRRARQLKTDSGFSVISAGDVEVNPVTLLATDRLADILEKFAASYDIVIVDGPPVLGLADAVLIARSVEAVLLVVEANRTHSSEIAMAVSRLTNANVIGGIVTKFDSKVAGVRYGDSEYYTYRNDTRIAGELPYYGSSS